MDSAYDWKQFYNNERAGLGSTAMLALVDEVEPLRLHDGEALIIPHTRFEITGSQIATAVATVLDSGTDRVLALGVLHGARRCDSHRVQLARGGDREARTALRGVHEESGIAAEEFSLDGFVELLTLAAEQRGRSIEIVRRYPFLVGDNPASLPGLEELQELVDSRVMLVVTTDPMHHGNAYDTPESECMAQSDPRTLDAVHEAIEQQLSALSDHRFGDFAGLVERDRSDFRDTGPVLAHLLGSSFASQIHELALVDYAEVLGSPAPSWVAGALITSTSVRK